MNIYEDTELFHRGVIFLARHLWAQLSRFQSLDNPPENSLCDILLGLGLKVLLCDILPVSIHWSNPVECRLCHNWNHPFHIQGINFSPQRQAPGQCHGHFQMMEWNVSHIFPPAVAQQCSAPLFQPFKKTRFWGPNEIKTLTNLCPSCFCLNMGIPATPLAHLLLEWVSCKKKYNPPGCWHTLYLEQGCCTSFRQNIGPLCDAYEKGWKLKTISTYLVVVCHHALLLQSHQIYLSAS